MDVIYRQGEAPATKVAAALKAEGAFDSIRVTLGILEKKGHLKKRRDGNRTLQQQAAFHALGTVPRRCVNHLVAEHRG